MYKNFSKLLQALILAGCCQLPIIAQVNAQPNQRIDNPRVKYVDRNTANQKATEIFLESGKFTIIKFEESKESSIEKISNVSISDPSRNNYFISEENNTGQQGKVVFVRQTKPIEFPKATTAQVPNLVVLTVDRAGNEEEFIFNINNDNPELFTEKIVITEPEIKPKIDRTKNTIETTYGTATPQDIKLGLDTLIESGKLPNSDNLISQINEYYALTINGTSSKTARIQLNISLSSLVELAKIGQQEDTKQRLTATPVVKP